MVIPILPACCVRVLQKDLTTGMLFSGKMRAHLVMGMGVRHLWLVAARPQSALAFTASLKRSKLFVKQSK